MNEFINELKREQNIEVKYRLILDYITEKLDNDMKKNNYCDFKDGKCIANRLGKSCHAENGCCYVYKEGLCHNLEKNGCTINCLSCKLFMCSYIEKKYKKRKINDFFPAKVFFNRKQINVLNKSFFKDKEEILKLLIKYKK